MQNAAELRNDVASLKAIIRRQEEDQQRLEQALEVQQRQQQKDLEAQYRQLLAKYEQQFAQLREQPNLALSQRFGHSSEQLSPEKGMYS